MCRRAGQRQHQYHRQLVRAFFPFDNLDIRRAMALALDRPAFVSILFEDRRMSAPTMLPAPGGLWAMPRKCWRRYRATGLT